MSRTTDKARAAVGDAEAEVARWTAALDEAEAAASAADNAEATDPADLDRIGQDAVRATARATAARRALATASDRVDPLRRAALRAEADDEAEAARSARKAYDKHAGQVRSLLDQLEKLDGVRYGNAPRHSGPGWANHPSESTALAMYNRVSVHEARAAVLRFVATHGHAPTFVHELDARPEGLHVSDQLTGEHVPESVRAYVAATTPDLAPEPEAAPPAATYTERVIWPPEEAHEDFRDPVTAAAG